uniref:Nuclear receptor n=1 Tax=Steinernema glaseri TaxID=37863 RepID=A0A1I8ALL7_9BILA
MPPALAHICAICGAPARCLHYDVMSCIGCKSFFRRSVVLGKLYECIGRTKGACEVYYENSRFCQLCRFEKCIQKGMKPELIQPNGKEEAEQLTAYTRKRNCSISSYSEDDLPPMKRLFSAQDTYGYLIDNLCYLETKMVELRTSSIDPMDSAYLDLPDLLARQCQIGDSHKYPRPLDSYLDLPDLLARQCQLGNSHKYPRPLDCKLPVPQNSALGRKNWLLLDLMLTIDFCKCIPTFCALSFRDQVVLCKRVVLSSARFTQAFYSYLNNSSTLYFPDGSMPLNFFSHEKTKVELEIFCGSIEPVRRNAFTKEEYLFLKTVILLNADCPQLSDEGRQILEKGRTLYANAFLRYLQANYGTTQGAVRFTNAISIIRSLCDDDQKHKGLHIMFEAKVAKMFGMPRPIALIDTIMIN